MDPAQPSSGRERRASTDMRTPVAFFGIAALAVATLVGVGSLRSLGVRFDASSILSFLPILTVLWVLLFVEMRKRPYSLHFIHLIALYIFLAAAPMYQVALGEFPLERHAGVTSHYVILANAACALWIAGYSAGYFYTHFVVSRKPEWRLARNLRREVSTGRVRTCLLLIFPVLAYLVYMGFGGVLTRYGAAETASAAESTPFMLINKIFVRAFPFVALGAGLAVVRNVGLLRAPGMALVILFALAGVLYADNPFAAARYWTVAVLLGFFAPHALRKRATGTLLLAGMIFGLAIMPGLGATRHVESTSELMEELTSQSLPSPVIYLATSGDVGAYGVLNLSFRWLEQHDHTWGRQLLGGFLFWFPRSYWPDKPISTGGQITGDMGFDFTTISAPILVEPLIDFGWLGVPLFAMLFGAILAYLDVAYYADRGGPKRLRVVDTFYPFLLGMVLFMTRGNFMSAIAYTMGMVLAAFPLVMRAPRLFHRPTPSAESALGPTANQVPPDSAPYTFESSRRQGAEDPF
jgi:hypothetical protein